MDNLPAGQPAAPRAERDDNSGPTRARGRARPAVAAAASLGTPLAAAMFHPLLAEIVAIVEAAIVLTVLATALFGSKILSERAFRLLRWFRNRPEPPAPTS